LPPGVGVAPVGRFSFGDVMRRLYRAPFALDFDFVSLLAMSPLVVSEKSAVFGIAAIDRSARSPLRMVQMSLVVVVLCPSLQPRNAVRKQNNAMRTHFCS